MTVKCVQLIPRQMPARLRTHRTSRKDLQHRLGCLHAHRLQVRRSRIGRAAVATRAAFVEDCSTLGLLRVDGLREDDARKARQNRASQAPSRHGDYNGLILKLRNSMSCPVRCSPIAPDLNSG